MSHTPKNSEKRAGFSLVEIIVALTIFAFVSIGIAHGVIQLKTTSRSLTFEQTVDETVQGYISQLKAMDYNELATAISTGTGATLQIENNLTLLSLADPNITRVENFLTLNSWTTHTLQGHDQLASNEDEATSFDVSMKLEMDNHNASEIAPEDRRRYITARIEYTWEAPLRPSRTEFREFIIGDGSNEL
ncbi:MAG: type IV pilus modification PilV family protein [Opitutales bacterium]